MALALVQVGLIAPPQLLSLSNTTVEDFFLVVITVEEEFDFGDDLFIDWLYLWWPLELQAALVLMKFDPPPLRVASAVALRRAKECCFFSSFALSALDI